MAARRKSTKKAGATATAKQKSASRTARGGVTKGRTSAKRSKVSVKPKAKSSPAKVARKRPDATKAAAKNTKSSTRNRAKVGKHASTSANAQPKTNKKARARGKVSTTAGTPNAKRVEAKLQTKIEQPSKTKSAVHPPVTTAAPPEPHKAASSRSVSEAPAVKAAPAVKEQKAAPREAPAAASKAAKSGSQRQGFKLSEFVVYPAHGVGQIVAIEEQEVAGFKLELFVISFSKDKMTLRVPTSKGAGAGMRKISDPDTARRSLEILHGTRSRQADHVVAQGAGIRGQDQFRRHQRHRRGRPGPLPIGRPARAIVFGASIVRGGAGPHGARDRRGSKDKRARCASGCRSPAPAEPRPLQQDLRGADRGHRSRDRGSRVGGPEFASSRDLRGRRRTHERPRVPWERGAVSFVRQTMY